MEIWEETSKLADLMHEFEQSNNIDCAIKILNNLNYISNYVLENLESNKKDVKENGVKLEKEDIDFI